MMNAFLRRGKFSTKPENTNGETTNTKFNSFWPIIANFSVKSPLGTYCLFDQAEFFPLSRLNAFSGYHGGQYFTDFAGQP